MYLNFGHQKLTVGKTKNQNFIFEAATDYMDFPGGSVVKNLPAKAGDTGDVGSIPGREDPLEGMAINSSILA